MSDAYHPWWRATVDGHEAPVVRAQYAFMGVPVAPGHHAVELLFVPPLLVRVADTTSAGAWLVLPLGFTVAAIRARRRAPAAS